GFPFTVWADENADWSGLNQFGDRVRLSGIPLVTNMNDPDNAFNGSAFLTPTIGSVGTVGRNAFRGPGFVSFDMSVGKRFRMTEGTNLEFKADFFNAFNHANFRLPVSRFTSSSFGKITAMADTNNPARVIQLGLRLEF